jgi:hypothetical protein
MLAVTGAGAFGAVPAVVADYRAKATPAKAGPTVAMSVDSSSSSTYVADTQNALTTQMPTGTTATLRPKLLLADASYMALGPQPSAVRPPTKLNAGLLMNDQNEQCLQSAPTGLALTFTLCLSSSHNRASQTGHGTLSI